MRLLSLLRSVSSRSDIRSQVRCRCLYLASQTKMWSQENTANLSTNPTKPINELKVAQTESDVSVEQTTSSEGKDGVRSRYNSDLSEWEKWALVYTKIYPNKESIPKVVPSVKMSSCQDKLRTRMALYITVICLSTCLLVSANHSIKHKSRSGQTMNEYANSQLGLKSE